MLRLESRQLGPIVVLVNKSPKAADVEGDDGALKDLLQ